MLFPDANDKSLSGQSPPPPPRRTLACLVRMRKGTRQNVSVRRDGMRRIGRMKQTKKENTDSAAIDLRENAPMHREANKRGKQKRLRSEASGMNRVRCPF